MSLHAFVYNFHVNTGRLFYFFTHFFENTTINMAFPCKKCDKVYTERKNLLAHEKSKHSEEIEIFQCPETNCHSKCNSKYSMKNHIREFHKKYEKKLIANMGKFTKTIKNKRKFEFFFSFYFLFICLVRSIFYFLLIIF